MSDSKEKTVTAGPKVPSQAGLQGSLNNSYIGDDVRNPEPVDPKALDKGPKRDAATGRLAPAKYRTAKGNIRIDR